MHIMKQLADYYPDINWICLDWKGEYKYLSNEVKSQKIMVLVPGSDIAPVHLNMFDPQKSNSDEHSRKLFGIKYLKVKLRVPISKYKVKKVKSGGLAPYEPENQNIHPGGAEPLFGELGDASSSDNSLCQ